MVEGEEEEVEALVDHQVVKLEPLQDMSLGEDMCECDHNRCQNQHLQGQSKGLQ